MFQLSFVHNLILTFIMIFILVVFWQITTAKAKRDYTRRIFSKCVLDGYSPELCAAFSEMAANSQYSGPSNMTANLM